MNMMIAGTFLFALGATLVEDPPPRPNVILVMTDDQGYGEFSCHGNPIAHTPNIDRLASESVRLTSCLGSSGIAQFRFISVR